VKITGIILAGGLARRMGGVDKGLIPFLGKPMIAHVIDELKPQVADILINANREIDQYCSFGFPVMQDTIENFAGPLAGLHTGMKHAKTEFVLSVPCDSPLLPNNLAIHLMAALQTNNADIAIAKTGVQTHPVFCLCRTSLVSDLEKFLTDGGRKVEDWQERHHLVVVNFDDQSMAFSNINTMNDLTQLERLAINKN
jgi:molybdenum cofactor guanylyltransferase